jgi:hypothetical protein
MSIRNPIWRPVDADKNTRDKRKAKTGVHIKLITREETENRIFPNDLTILFKSTGNF